MKSKLRVVNDVTGLWIIQCKEPRKRAWKRYGRLYYSDDITALAVADNLVNLYSNEFERG